VPVKPFGSRELPLAKRRKSASAPKPKKKRKPKPKPKKAEESGPKARQPHWWTCLVLYQKATKHRLSVDPGKSGKDWWATFYRSFHELSAHKVMKDSDLLNLYRRIGLYCFDWLQKNQPSPSFSLDEPSQ
jgi:hypothetical protein